MMMAKEFRVTNMDKNLERGVEFLKHRFGVKTHRQVLEKAIEKLTYEFCKDYN